MKLEHILLAVTLCFMHPALGQFSDDFSDGNLDGWEGDAANFIVNPENELQLNAPSGSTLSWLHVPVSFQDSMTWEFYLKMDFAPSTSNLLRIYLGINSTDYTTATGYYLEIGSSGDTDPLILNFINNGAPAPIAQSVDGLVALQPVEMTIRVVKHENGNWEIYKIGGAIPELLFSAFHNVIPLSQLNTFGFYCKYTETRRDKFYFDNINIAAPQPDVTAPSFVSLNVVDNNTVELTFDEPIEDVSATALINYVLTPGNLNPANVSVNANVITLDWTANFISLQEYTLHISNLKDEAGNVMMDANPTFIYTEVGHAEANELLITEIMADPTPLISLPDAEYLELFNNSDKVLRLSDYKVKVGSGERDLPNEIFFPQEYVILVSADDAALFQTYGRVVAVDLPALTNSGTYVALLDQQDNILHELTYDLGWYDDSEKQDGGWSLEMLNPNFQCYSEPNWSASINLSGGTPGNQNSQWSTLPDISGPFLVTVYVSSPTAIELRYDEKIDPLFMSDPSIYSIVPFIAIANVLFPDPNTVQLNLSQPLQEGVVYQLLPFESFDCLGNSRLSMDTIEFGLVLDAIPGDILINEVLFNPATGGSRFLEIINTTGKFLNLSSLVIARLTSTDQDLYPTGLNETLGPHGIAAFTPDRQDILSRYTVPFPNHLYESDLPSWDDDTDNVSLLVNGIVIDSFTYSSDWHHPVIADQNGVSLERVSTEVGTTIASNWHSASSLRGNATPTGENSQRLNTNVPAEQPFTITTRNFSPNGDGFRDFLALEFNADSPDAITSVWVYDREGREVNQLVSNESIGSQALVTWDGRTKESGLATMGIYILFVRIWNTNGEVKDYQESFALIDR